MPLNSVLSCNTSLPQTLLDLEGQAANLTSENQGKKVFSTSAFSMSLVTRSPPPLSGGTVFSSAFLLVPAEAGVLGVLHNPH